MGPNESLILPASSRAATTGRASTKPAESSTATPAPKTAATAKTAAIPPTKPRTASGPAENTPIDKPDHYKDDNYQQLEQ